MADLSLHDAWMEWDLQPASPERVTAFSTALKAATDTPNKTLAALQAARRRGATYHAAIAEVLGG